MAFWTDIVNKLSDRIAASVTDRMAAQPVITARAYRSGYYRPQLRVQGAAFDDNIGINLVGLLVNRIVSQMLGGGFKLDFEGEGETENERYVNAVLEANKQEVLFHRGAVSASEAGIGYLLFLPDGIVGEDGNSYPRLQLIDPAFVRMDTLPEDYEVIVRYTIEYKFRGADGKDHARRRVIEHNAPDVAADGSQSGGNTWVIRDFEDHGSGRFEPTNEVLWPFDFAPILHWQNLPNPTGAMGEPDVTDAQLALQDRINFVSSNISKLIRYYAHPMRFSRYAGTLKSIDVGPDQMPNFENDLGGIFQLEPLGDLASSMTYLATLRQAFFACGRVVDLDSMTDKLGSLTNFGLRVLYQDNLNLIATKRELFGDMLEELARRLQILAGMVPIETSVIWPDFLPVDAASQAQLDTALVTAGVMSKQTMALNNGLDWEQEAQRMDAEQQVMYDNTPEQ